MTEVLHLHRAGVQFGAHQALCDVNLSIHAGERVALVGANGCGKSTLLRVAHGLLPVTQGHVTRVSTVRQAMVFQRPHMLRCVPHLRLLHRSRSPQLLVSRPVLFLNR